MYTHTQKGFLKQNENQMLPTFIYKDQTEENKNFKFHIGKKQGQK